jgi:Disulphide bond corrector protein DsbC
MIKRIFLLLAILAGAYFSIGQTPYKWTFTSKKTADRTYEIHFTMDLSQPWHTYSQFTPDGGPLPTKFTFGKNPLFALEGKVKENGKMVVKHEEVFGVDVKYFDGRVDFVQVVRLKADAKTNFSGTVEFMICNDQQCLPPATEKFSLALN